MDILEDTIRILHVDDESDFSDLVATFLEREDDRFDIETATSADEGLDRLATETFDCIVSDYDMPGRDGIEFLRAVRTDHPDLPFILFTGKGSEEVASEAIGAGATDYLQKGGGTEQYNLLANRVRNAVDQYRANREAEQTRRRLQELAESTADCLWMFDSDWTELLFISGYEDIWNRPTEAIEENPEDFLAGVDPADRDAVRRAMERLSNGESIDIEYRIRREDGERGWVWVKGEPVFDDEGTVVRVVGFTRDITGRKRREQQLHQTTARVEALFENSPDMINVHDTEGNIIDPNPRLCEKTGYDARELTEMKVWELDQAIDPDDVRDIWEGMDVGDSQRLEGVYQRRDGSTFPIEAHIRRLSLDGEDRFVAIARDTTDRKERERELQRKERRYQTVFNDPNILAGILTPDGILIEQNQTALNYIDADPADVTDEPFWELPWWDEETRPLIQRKVERAADGNYVEYEADLTRADGQPYSVTGVIRPVTDESDTVVSLFVSARDITQRREHERELQRIRDFFREAERLGNLGAWEFDASGEAVWTEGTRQIHEVDDGFQPTVESGIDFFHPADRSEIERAIETALESGESYDLRARLITATDTERWVRVRGKPLTDGTVRGYIQDITAQKEREQELEDTYERMEHALDVTDSTIYEIDLAERTETRHGPFERLFGVPTHEVTSTTEFYEQCVHPEDRARLERLQSGDFRTGDTLSIEFRTHPERGEVRWIHSEGYVQADTDSTARRLIGLDTDITDRKNREREFRRLKEEYKSVFDHVQDSLFLIEVTDSGGDPEFEMGRINPANAELFDISPDSIRGKTPEDAFGNDIGSKMRANYRRCLDHREPVRYEEELPVEGDLHTFETTLTPVEIDGDVTRIVGVAHDVTDRKQREQALQRERDKLEEFVGIVSHDLRNPLRVAEGRLGLAQEDCDSEHLEAVATALDRMSALIEDLLTLAREGKPVGETEPVALSDLAREGWRTVETAGATLNVLTERTIRADRSRLQQFLENLMRNAVEHGGDDTTVTIGDLDDGFYIEDDGPGIPAAEHDEVFEAGYSTNEDGTGFGLRIVKQVADAHGWEIRVTESSTGGTRFEISGVEFAE